MISFNLLGRMGRLGNQMFQYAALFGVARRRGFDFVIPSSPAQDLWREHQLFEAFSLPGVRHTGIRPQNPRVRPRTFAYDAELAATCPDDCDLRGFFQSELYFRDVAGQLREELAFHPPVASEARRRLAEVGGAAISLHVRRGDYLTLSHNHALLGLDYYAAALKLAPPEPPVIVFSDDLDWCREQALFHHDRFVFAQPGSNILDLCLMSLCDHHIIANSSFSWWGAWLAGVPGEQVVAPDPEGWFGPANAHLAASDLLPRDWLRVSG